MQRIGDRGTALREMLAFEQASPFTGPLTKMAASPAIDVVAMTPAAGQLGIIARKTIARRLISWMFQPT